MDLLRNTMVFFVYGTTAEYIKIMPLVLELSKRGQCYTIALSQHEDQLIKFFRTYPELPKPDLWLVHGFRGHDLAGFYQIPFWFAKVVAATLRSRKAVRRAASAVKAKNLWMVHGDTFTTVVGAVWGRLLGYKVAHVEAGLRSHNLLHPLPEELDRLAVTRLARVHFAPGATPVQNLARAKGDIIDTHVNTSYDAIQYARRTTATIPIPDLPKHFGIVSLHRTEFVANRPVFERTLRTLAEYGAKMPLVFLQQPVTIATARDMGLEHLLKQNFLYVPKLDYFSFIKLLDRSDFVVTDSGGLQEDCTYMRKPCLLIRKATERQEGLAEGITKLSHYDDDILRAFLDNPTADIKGDTNPPTPPLQIVMQYLEDKGYTSKGPAD